jgi:hypothetical protein
VGHGGGGGGGLGGIRINQRGAFVESGGAIISPAPNVGTVAVR